MNIYASLPAYLNRTALTPFEVQLYGGIIMLALVLGLLLA